MEKETYSHFRMPKGKEGREVLEGMNQHHADLTDWALQLVANENPGHILDIGCGGGMALAKMANLFPESQLTGIDLSPESIHFSAHNNAEIQKEGRLKLHEASVSNLPYDENSFDMVTAFETYFFWPELVSDMTEAVRVLRPGGHLLVVSESYPHPDYKERNEQNATQYGLKLIENEKMVSLLNSLSLKTSLKVKENLNWVAFLGRKI